MKKYSFRPRTAAVQQSVADRPFLETVQFDHLMQFFFEPCLLSRNLLKRDDINYSRTSAGHENSAYKSDACVTPMHLRLSRCIVAELNLAHLPEGTIICTLVRSSQCEVRFVAGDSFAKMFCVFPSLSKLLPQ